MTGEAFALTGKTMTMLIDCGAILLLLVSAAIGAYRGMIKMLAGLAALILALVGATLIAAQFTDTVLDMVTPMVESSVTDAVQEAMDGENLGKLIGGYAQEQAEETLEETMDETSFHALNFGYLSELFSKVQTENLFPKSLTESLETRIEDMRQDFTGTISQALSAAVRSILRPIVHGLLYAVSFLALSFVLKIAFRSLNGVSAIPGLRSVNSAGGFVLGAAQGVVIVIVAAFLLRFVFFKVDGVSNSQVLKALALFIPSLAFPA